ncbi:MAG: serine hydrolase [Rhizobacter sp.]|nr:serine hydrolase [Ferruginibacter sp.]
MKLLILFFTYSFVIVQSQAQPHSRPALEKTIDSIALHQQWQADIPGLAVAVLMNNELLYKKALGVENLATGKKLTSLSDFHMASVSKPFAGTAILQLAERGKLQLDSSLVFYLPYFNMKDPRYKKITIYHLLTHSSGMADVSDYQWDKPQNDKDAAERYAKSFVDKELDFEPGSQFHYSNAAYNILAALIKHVSELSFEDYLYKNILVPAGMNSSSFLFSDIESGRRTASHIIDQDLQMAVSKSYPYNRIHAPSSTLHSDLEDMLQWTKLFLNKGKINGRQIISESTWKQMLQPRFVVNEQYKVCFSWFETIIGGRKIYFHSGGDLGYRTFVGFEPVEKIAIVLMGNNELFDAAETGFSIFRSIILKVHAQTELKPIHLELRKYVLKEGMEKLKQVYQEEKLKTPARYDTGAESILSLVSWLFDRNHRELTIEVLLWGASQFPGDVSWYGHLGDVWTAWGEKSKAIGYYRQGLAIDPANKELLQKIDTLEK